VARGSAVRALARPLASLTGFGALGDIAIRVLLDKLFEIGAAAPIVAGVVAVRAVYSSLIRHFLISVWA